MELAGRRALVLGGTAGIGLATAQDLERAGAQVAAASREQVRDLLVATGLWPALRTRPFSRTPGIDDVPHSIFVTAVDTAPLAADPRVVIAERAEDFSHGLDLLAKLTDGALHLCVGDDADAIPSGNDARIRREAFSGPHPAGLAGTHIHFLDPVGPNKTVWTIGYQDVIAIGRTAASGSYCNERVVALGGPPVDRPRLLRTVQGASLVELTAGETTGNAVRVLSGSVLTGHIARGALAFLGRFHVQVSALVEDMDREFLHYLRPGTDRFSVFPVFASKWFGSKRFPMTTSANGSARAMVPIGTFEDVVPMDMLPTQLLRALLVGDLDTAIALGALELDEDDVALCTFACPGKYEYGPVLRSTLDRIHKEG